MVSEHEWGCWSDDSCNLVVDRHQGRLVFLEYKGEGEINSTVMLVGKGITYDTGGLDIKAGGIMVGLTG